MRSSVMDFLLLLLRVSFNHSPDAIHEVTGVSKILSAEGLEINLRQGSYSIGLDSRLVLVPTESDHSAKERSYKGCAIGTGDTGGVEVVARRVGITRVEVRETGLQKTVSGALLLRTICLGLKERVHAELHVSKSQTKISSINRKNCVIDLMSDSIESSGYTALSIYILLLQLSPI